MVEYFTDPVGKVRFPEVDHVRVVFEEGSLRFVGQRVDDDRVVGVV